MSTGFISSGPGCLVSCSVEDQIANAKSSAEAALRVIENAQNALQVVGPLRGLAGARLSPRERHIGLEVGHGRLEIAVESLEEALDALHIAISLMTGR
ncbi:hypothetical protein BDV29DRAFT_161659 [Aspergillus leporis]|uniref:Uncharacterized protein n=1 Tax=Aspergillus leporis TaxID=41062 RepID=A0A5N5WKZ2_9EURO|nr:hypothetical protein BDV29DRAFT_161659 [Aspergillus leporis]